MGAKRDFALLKHGHSLGDLDDLDITSPSDNSLLQYDSASGTWQDASLASFNSQLDHGALTGLGDDDHTQYHTDARALTWLGTRSTTDLPEGTRLYFTDERAQDAVGLNLVDSSSVDFTYNDGAGTITAVTINANPTGTIGLTAVNGTAATPMRSDAAPALSQAIAPTWTGTHTFSPASGRTTFNAVADDFAFAAVGSSTVGQSYGFFCQAGTNSSDRSFNIFSAATGNRDYMVIRGDGRISFGNTTDNPTYRFLGTGTIELGGTTTGAQTATFTATNKPGSGTAGPIAWLPVILADGSTAGYIPIFGA